MSLLSIVNLVLLYVVRDENLDTVLFAMNGLISLILLVDFVYRLATAPSKGRYLLRQYGWADLLSALPLQQVKVFRLFRLVASPCSCARTATETCRGSLVRNRAGSALLSLLLLGILVLEFGSLWVLAVEEGAPGATITSASDAIWYVLVTISTVGYGDEFPVTTEGRLSVRSSSSSGSASSAPSPATSPTASSRRSHRSCRRTTALAPGSSSCGC